MSLKGSLQTVALPEVLQFLADTEKSGEFHVSGRHGDGRLWFTDGRICGFDAARAVEAHDAIFEMMRIADADFDFEADAECPVEGHQTEPTEVGPAIDAAESRMIEWLEIVEVVPSLEHSLQLRAEAPGEQVVLEPDQWRMIVSIAGGCTVGTVIESRELQEFAGCQAIRALVDAHLVEVLEPAAAPVAVDTEGQKTEAVVDEDAIPGQLLRFGVESSSESEKGDSKEGESGEGEHYSALRAAISDMGDDVTPVTETAEAGTADSPVYELQSDPELDGRAALQALLSEVTSAEETGLSAAAGRDPVDGLADRGPWTEHELSSMDNEGDWSKGSDDSNILPFAPVHGSEKDEDVVGSSAGPEDEGHEDEGHEDESAESEEPINRGLLLKFLSSVRN